MIRQVGTFVRGRPQLYDIAIRTKRLFGWKSATYDFFNKFSQLHNNSVNFIHIGANDGLHNDPIREFVIRDKWEGILIEPLPEVFVQLKENYSQVKGSRLLFVNAAVSAQNSESISFWTFNGEFLATLPFEERMACLRKSSISKDRLAKFLKARGYNFDQAIKEVKVPCMTLNHLIQKYWVGREVDLLVIDSEGCDAAILIDMDFRILNPTAIFFETMHLGPDKDKVFDLLSNNNYKVSEVHGDAIAYRAGLM